MHPDNSPAQIHTCTVGDRHDDWSRVHAPLFQTQWAVVRMRMIQTFDLWTTDPKTPVRPPPPPKKIEKKEKRKEKKNNCRPGRQVSWTVFKLTVCTVHVRCPVASIHLHQTLSCVMQRVWQKRAWGTLLVFEFPGYLVRNVQLVCRLQDTLHVIS